jgi:hypothetical protein
LATVSSSSGSGGGSVPSFMIEGDEGRHAVKVGGVGGQGYGVLPRRGLPALGIVPWQRVGSWQHMGAIGTEDPPWGVIQQSDIVHLPASTARPPHTRARVTCVPPRPPTLLLPQALRLKEGDEIELCDGRGGSVACAICTVERVSWRVWVRTRVIQGVWLAVKKIGRRVASVFPLRPFFLFLPVFCVRKMRQKSVCPKIGCALRPISPPRCAISELDPIE